MLKMQAIQSLSPVAAGGGKWGTAAKVGLSLLGSFDSGGIIPGGYMKPGLAVVHGQEEVLRPDDPRHRFNAGKGGGGMTIVNAPQITTGAKREDVLAALRESNRELAEMVNGIVMNNTGGQIRKTIRSV